MASIEDGANGTPESKSEGSGYARLARCQRETWEGKASGEFTVVTAVKSTKSGRCGRCSVCLGKIENDELRNRI